jgi:putative oxidoreductase
MTARIQPFAVLIARIAIGFTFAMHGWQKWNAFGIDGTTAFFAMFDVPLPQTSAYIAATVELVGGILLVLGAFLPVAGVLLAATMAGAMVTVHWQFGFWMEDFGFELVLALGAAALALAFSGGGALSVDGFIARLRGANAAEESDAPAEAAA